MMHANHLASATEILSFWFEEAGPEKWFSGGDAFDAAVRGRFEVDAINAAMVYQRGQGHDWLSDRHSALALILMLDQFPRNMYRGTKAMFAWDGLALDAAKKSVAQSFDLRTDQDRRAFFYMPYMHSENAADQSECVYLIDQRIDNENTLYHARQHKKLIDRFGRFPHRNAILGRISTPEEQAFLDKGGYSP